MNRQNSIQIVAAEKMKLIYESKQYVLSLTMRAAKLDLRVCSGGIRWKEIRKMRLRKECFFKLLSSQIMNCQLCLCLLGRTKAWPRLDRPHTIEEQDLQHFPELISGYGMETIQVNASQRNSVSGYIQLFSSMDDKKKQKKKPAELA